MELDGGDPEQPVDGPRGDVDELHAAVRDDDEPAEHDAAAHEQVVGALGVSVGADPAADEPPQPYEGDERDTGCRPRDEAIDARHDEECDDPGCNDDEG